MSLVSLGSCLFTINSAFAFLNGPMEWDASRISAAIPSGVGFLGAGLIFKKEERGDNGDSNHVVHGLTTAASLWLSAAVGIACGGDLFMPASFGVAIMLLLLRFGPRAAHEGEVGEEHEHEEDVELTWKKDDDKGMETPPMNNVITTESSGALENGRGSTNVQDYSSIASPAGATNDETASLTNSFRMTQTERSANAAQKRKSVKRSQPALGSMV
jgi:putative Mg2+ transporter-C (MgtC) family protein